MCRELTIFRFGRADKVSLDFGNMYSLKNALDRMSNLEKGFV
jgi:hypothetical protein